jgi:hypothetical protein
MGALSLTVANSSSDSGIGPVRRTLAPYSDDSFKSAAAWRMASEAALPGSSAVKSRIGWTSMNRRNSLAAAGSFHQDAPGKARRISGENRVQRVGQYI